MPHQCLKCGQLFNEGSTTILRGCPECRGTRFFYTQTPLTMSERDKLLATSEVSLREAIDQLVKQAQEGKPPQLPPGADKWLKVEPVPEPAAEQPALVSPMVEPEPLPTKFIPLEKPGENPASVPLVKPAASASWLPGNKLLIKMAETPKPKRGRRESVQFDYAPPPPPPAPAPAPVVAKPVEEPAVPVTGLLPTPPAEEQYVSSEGPPETIRIANPGQYEIDVKRLLEDNPVVIQRDGTYLIHLASLFEAAGKRRA